MWNFIQNQILGMQWLNDIIAILLTTCGIDLSTRMGASLHFFIYDTFKILMLLSVLIFIISYIQSYFPPERTKKILGKYRGIGANSLSALLGTITPFCSCSSIPLFMGFTSAGLPIGVTFSFLISSPLVDLASLVLLMSVFGWKVAIAYVIVGLILAIAGGSIIEKLHMEQYIEDFAKKPAPSCGCACSSSETNATEPSRIRYAFGEVRSTVKKVFWYIIIGVAIGALIHNWIPTEWIQSILGYENPFSVILATIVGIPMYADIFGTIPIAEALFAKGVGIGTVLSFMMGVTALSLPSMIMIKKVVKVKLLIVFISIVTGGIIAIGYLFNALQFLFM